MEAHIVPLFESQLIRIFDFQCQERPFAHSKVEYSDASEIIFIRSGYFSVERGSKTHDVDARHVLFSSESSSQRVRHGERTGDRCTIFQMNSSHFPERVRFDAAVTPVTPVLDVLHHLVFRSLTEGGNEPISKLRIETLATELLSHIGHSSFSKTEPLPFGRLSNQHLESIERAKQYLLQNFDQDVSLLDVARAAHVSEFHFSRTFKQLTSMTPYRYLVELRLHHAAVLLRNTSLPVTRICFDSGFSNLPHFVSSFHRKFGKSPRNFRSHR